MKMLLVPAEGCERATEEMWCCLSVRVSDLMVSYDFFSEFYSAPNIRIPKGYG